MTLYHIYIALVILCIIAIIVLVVLWATGKLDSSNQNNTKNPIEEEESIGVTEDNRIEDVSEYSPKTIEEWLYRSQPTQDEYMYDLNEEDNRSLLSFDVEETGWSRHVITPPPNILPGDSFGYSMDAGNGVICVSAPKHEQGIVLIYALSESLSEPYQTIMPPTDRHRWFGHKCVLSPNAQILTVQSDQAVLVYRVSQDPVPKFEFECELEDSVGFIGNGSGMSGCHLVCASPEDTIWITYTSTNTLKIFQHKSGQWVSQSYNLTRNITDMSFESESRHMWVSTSDGLTHWSETIEENNTSSPEWLENVVWLDNHLFTTVEQMRVDGFQQTIALGQAQNDRVSLHCALNPSLPICVIQPPLRRFETHTDTYDLIMYGDRVVWWPMMNQCFIAASVQSQGHQKDCGCVYMYKMKAKENTLSAKLCALLRAPDSPSTRQLFGHDMKLVDDYHFAISAIGTEHTQGSITLLTCEQRQ
jgi:hypothetical protein